MHRLAGNESCGQQSSTVFDTNIISTVDLCFLVDKMQSTLAAEKHPSRYHHVLRKLFTLNQETKWLHIGFLASCPDSDSAVLITSGRVQIEVILVSEEHVSCREC